MQHFNITQFASLNLRDNQRYSKASYISARNKSWLNCGLSHVQLINSYCLKTMTFLTVYNQRLLEKSLIPHRVRCWTEAVNKLSRPLEIWKMIKIILSKRKLTKISESVIPHQTLFQHQFGFAMHLTWKVTNVTFIFATYPNT